MDAKATKNKIDETKKDKRADILIICLLSSSNDLRTSCSKYQFYTFILFSVLVGRCSQVFCCLKASDENLDKSQNIGKLP